MAANHRCCHREVGRSRNVKSIFLWATENTFVNLVYSTSNSQGLIFSDLFLVLFLSRFSSLLSL